MVEGLNNKAKVIFHRAYGFRTISTYKCALYHCMGSCQDLNPVLNSCKEPSFAAI
ncbi:MAG: transposase [Spirochaetales bacterium]|nr:transposase [Spirochaetales bacterium]